MDGNIFNSQGVHIAIDRPRTQYFSFRGETPTILKAPRFTNCPASLLGISQTRARPIGA
jgi:hypothetical protein